MEIELISQLYRQDLTEFKYPVFTSKYSALILVEKGECQLRLKGQKAPILLKENEIAFVPPSTEMERRALSPLSFCHFTFSVGADHPFYRAMPVGKLLLPAEKAQNILQSAGRAALLPDNRELITHIIAHAFAEQYLFGGAKENKLSEEVMRTVSYIQNHLDQPLDIDDLAARVFLSHSGLIWKFKKELGTTPSQYIGIQRLRFAKQLLLQNPRYTVTQIAELCGYSSPFYFTNRFREYSGMSPTEFRRRHLEEEP